MKKITLIFIISVLSFTSMAQNSMNEPLTYRVVGVQNGEDSIVSVSNEVKLYLPMKLYIPKAFTPNNDGLNDSFGAVGEAIEEYELNVFNRWGELIFSSNHIDVKWDGSYNGSLAPVGTYTYEVVAYGKEQGRVYKSGYVTLIN